MRDSACSELYSPPNQFFFLRATPCPPFPSTLGNARAGSHCPVNGTLSPTHTFSILFGLVSKLVYFPHFPSPIRFLPACFLKGLSTRSPLHTIKPLLNNVLCGSFLPFLRQGGWPPLNSLEEEGFFFFFF